MCMSREEMDSMRALKGTVDETVELSQSLYNAVVHLDSSIPMAESVTATRNAARLALQPPPLPVFAEEVVTRKD